LRTQKAERNLHACNFCVLTFSLKEKLKKIKQESRNIVLREKDAQNLLIDN
jgi:hypothetical protein